MHDPLPLSAITDRVTAVLRRDLKLGNDATIEQHTPLFGGDLDLDSIDALLLVASIEKEFGIKVPNEKIGRQVFGSVGTLAHYIHQQLTTAADAPAAAPAAPDAAALLARLPHRDPFRFVSELVHVEPGRSAEGLWNLTGDEAFFAGHFPGQPIVPGVLITEALAQLSGLVALSSALTPGTDTPEQGRLAHTRIRFRAPAQPPARIQLKSTLRRAMGHVQHYSVEASLNGVILADGELALALGA